MQNEKALLIRAAKMFDGVEESYAEDVSVLLKNGVIKEVSSGKMNKLPADAEVVEYDGVLLPGLIDAHTHITLDGGVDPVATMMQENSAQRAARAVENLRRHLAFGVTTIREMGAPEREDISLRDMVASGAIIGPRVIAAGKALCITGGHGFWMGDECDGAAGFARGARENLKAGADHLKIIATGGVLTEGVEPGSPQMSLEEMREVCEAARRANRQVGAHAQGTEGILNALKAGVKTIEHGFFIDDECIAEFREKGAFLLPTFAAADGMIDNSDRMPAFVQDKMSRCDKAQVDSFHLAVKSGVPIAAGTDCGTPFNPHGGIVRELTGLNRRGYPPGKCLIAATSGAAAAVGRSNIGRIAVGIYADLIGVHGDPLARVEDIAEPDLIIKNGVNYSFLAGLRSEKRAGTQFSGPR